MFEGSIVAQLNSEIDFKEFISSTNIDISIGNLAICMSLTVVLSWLLSLIYIKHGMSLSNRKSFANNFILLAMTTMLVITLVKSSLALSLGLVGALSIVRFRAAIKEPEELSYLFLCIGIGLGMGAGQIIATMIAFSFIAIVLVVKGNHHSKTDQQNMLLTISSEQVSNISLEKIICVLKEHCTLANLRRLDHNNDLFEALFVVEFANTELLHKTREALLLFDEQLSISFLDNSCSL